jgi:galactokinase
MKREQCEEGIAIVKNNFPEITSFRDCTEHHILGLQNVMSEAVFNELL